MQLLPKQLPPEGRSRQGNACPVVTCAQEFWTKLDNSVIRIEFRSWYIEFEICSGGDGHADDVDNDLYLKLTF